MQEEFLTFEDGTDGLFLKTPNHLPTYTTQDPRRTRIYQYIVPFLKYQS
jgi:hypothetical protein